jgi:uncharacterized protein (DUF1800 family)
LGKGLLVTSSRGKEVSWFQDIDPAWAWSDSEFRDRKIGRKRAAHLLRRTGFGVPINRQREFAELTALQAADRLFPDAEAMKAFQTSSASLRRLVLGTGDTKQAAAWWLFRMRQSPDPFREKMTLFWHSHFASSIEKVDETLLMVEQNDLLYEHAMGDFYALARGISHDPAMLIYLDSVSNRKRRPNENYARELMELFCLGEGNYSEMDVQELARCFTGWEIKGDRFRFNKYQHDINTKEILGRTSTFAGDEAIGWVVDHHSCPKFLVRKIVRFLVADEPQPPIEFLMPLVETLRNDHMSVKGMLLKLIRSNIFYSDQVAGRKVRSPIELAVGLMHTLDMTVDLVALSDRLHEIGQGLFRPPNVKGWPGGRAWINSSTLLGRANLVKLLMEDEKTKFAAGSLEATIQQRGAPKPDEQVRWLLDQLIAVPVPEDVHQQLIQLLIAGNGSVEQKLRITVSAIATLPEFQLN